MVSPGQKGYPAGAPGGRSIRPEKQKGQGRGFGQATPVIAAILLCVVPTFVWGIWQYGWLFSLLEDIANIVRPGTGLVVRWLLLFLIVFLPHAMLAAKVGGSTTSPYPDPRTGQNFKMYKTFASISLWISTYWVISILFIIFVKPVITDAFITPIANLGIQAISASPWADTTPQAVEVANKAGLKVTLPAGEQAKTLEQKLCEYKKFDERGNEITGDKQLSVVIDAPPWNEKGSFYRATLRIKNLGKEPVKLIISKGEAADFYKDKKDNLRDVKAAKGSYITGTKRLDYVDGDDDRDVYYLLTPLDCLPPNGCVVESGVELEKTAELVSPEGVVFSSNTAAELSAELKINYEDDKKGAGTGHLLIFKDRQDATARQKDPNFKNSYCPNAFAGPLDVVVVPPFYIAGRTSDGGDGYFKISDPKQCPTEIKDFRISGEYCIQNLKTATMTLKNIDSDARIKIKSIKLLPFKQDGRFPSDYTNEIKDLRKGTPLFGSGNCFIEHLGEGERGIIFKDEAGISAQGKSGEEAKGLDALGPFRTEVNIKCRYQINDFPDPIRQQLGFEPITSFKAYQFKAEVEYEYVTTVKRSGILMLSQE